MTRTRKRFIKKLMAIRIKRNDAIAIAKFIHNEQSCYTGVKIISTYKRIGTHRIDYICFRVNGLPYVYRNGHVYADHSVMGTSSLCYPTYNWTVIIPMIEGDAE